jgi:RyR domain
VHAQVHDPELCLALQARYLGLAHPPGLRLDFFNAEDLAARKLVADVPLTAVAGRAPEVLVVSASAFGRALIVELARVWRVADPAALDPLPITLVDPAADAVVDDLARRYPFLRRVCRFTIYHHDLLDLLGQGELREAPDRAFVCDDDEQRALKTAITADRFWHGAPNSVVVRLDQLAAFHHGLRFGGSLRVYGGIQAASDPYLIAEDLVERLARVIHDRYRLSRLADGADTGTNPFLVAWEDLPNRIRLANRAQAEDVGRKLHAIGCVLVPRGGHDESELRAAEIDKLAVMEHERWCAERTADGWRHAVVRDDAHKLHPAITDWDELPEQMRRLNYDAVRGLPGMLSDAGFQVVRA